MKMDKGCIYLWGDVLLIYNLRSTYLFAVLTVVEPSPSLTFDNQPIQKFIVADNDVTFAALTANGDIWLGRVSCCVKALSLKKLSENLASYTTASLSYVIGAFYDSYSKFNVLAVVQSEVKKYVIMDSEANRGNFLNVLLV